MPEPISPLPTTPTRCDRHRAADGTGRRRGTTARSCTRARLDDDGPHERRLPRRVPGPAGPLRHAPAGRSPARHVPVPLDAGGGPAVRRGGADVLPRHRRPRRPAAVLVQGRGARLRADPGPDGAVLPELRRQRHVPVDGQHRGQPGDPDAVHRLRAAQPGPRLRARRRSATTPPSSAATPAPSSPCTSRSTDVFPNCPRYIHRTRIPRAVAERPRRRPARPRSPSGSACRCSTTCSPPTIRPVPRPDLSRRAFLALGATIVVGACSSGDDDAAPTRAGARPRRHRRADDDDDAADHAEHHGADHDDHDDHAAADHRAARRRPVPARRRRRATPTPRPSCCGPGSSATCPTPSRSAWEPATDDTFADVARRPARRRRRRPTATASTSSPTSPAPSPTASTPAGSRAPSGAPRRPAPPTRCELAAATCQHWETGLLRRPPRPRRVGSPTPSCSSATSSTRAPRGPSARAACAPTTVPNPTDLAGYRARYAQYLSDADLQASRAACPWFVIWDDHEVENNYAALEPQDPADARRVRGPPGRRLPGVVGAHAGAPRPSGRGRRHDHLPPRVVRRPRRPRAARRPPVPQRPGVRRRRPVDGPGVPGGRRSGAHDARHDPGGVVRRHDRRITGDVGRARPADRAHRPAPAQRRRPQLRPVGRLRAGPRPAARGGRAGRRADGRAHRRHPPRRRRRCCPASAPSS